MASRRLQTATCPATAAACDAYRFSFGEGWILKFVNRAAATCGDSTPAGRRFRLLLLTNAEGRKLFNYCLWFCIETFGCGGPQPLELRTAMTLSCSAMRDSLPRHLQDRFVEWAAAVLARVVSWAALWLFPLDTALLDGRFRAACADVISLILLGGLAPDSVVPDRTWFRAVPAMAAEHHRLVENERIPGNSATLLRSADLEQDAWRLIPGGEKAPPGCVWDTRVLRNLSLPVLDEPVPPDWVLDDADAALLSSVRPKPKEHDDGSPVSKAFDETAAALARFAIRREDSREQTRRIRGDGELEVPEPDSERQAKSTRLLSGFGSLLVPSNTLKSGGGKLSTLKVRLPPEPGLGRRVKLGHSAGGWSTLQALRDGKLPPLPPEEPPRDSVSARVPFTSGPPTWSRAVGVSESDPDEKASPLPLKDRSRALRLLRGERAHGARSPGHPALSDVHEPLPTRHSRHRPLSLNLSPERARRRSVAATLASPARVVNIDAGGDFDFVDFLGTSAPSSASGSPVRGADWRQHRGALGRAARDLLKADAGSPATRRRRPPGKDGLESRLKGISATVAGSLEKAAMHMAPASPMRARRGGTLHHEADSNQPRLVSVLSVSRPAGIRSLLPSVSHDEFIVRAQADLAAWRLKRETERQRVNAMGGHDEFADIGIEAQQLRSKESIITDAAMSDARRRVGVYRAALEAAENAERVAAKARLRYAAQSRKADRESAARTASIMLRPAAVAELASTFFEEERLRQMDMQESLRHFRKLYLAGH